ncbi:esterase-like activity of phytase family protein [Qipengyuania sp. ASV99]|uniref:esterase-like activity of phytase family protein n=1 Tax=Qipengyuania sp. ASV99 TaxID=3399681 RepID=UPI003A4C65EF
MTWKSTGRTLLTAAALAMGALFAPAAPIVAQADIFPLTQPVMLDPADPDREEIGELIYRGGLVIEPGEAEIGGISGLEWHDGRLYAVIDDGRWLTMEPDEFEGRLIDLTAITIAPLLDERGRKLRGKEDSDAEAITRMADGSWLIAFEQNHRIWRYSADLASAAQAYPADLSGIVSAGPDNNGIETLVMTGDTLILCGEFVGEDRPNCRGIEGGQNRDIAVAAPIGAYNPVPTDAACASDGACYILLRDYTPGVGNHAAILAVRRAEEPRVIATFDPSITIDNFEGLALREQYGKTYLYIVSDNNFSSSQRTLLLKFEIKAAVAPVRPVEAVAPEPVVDYDTVDVRLETTLGDITMRIETERAPITAANFLRYVDEGRFDGTVFYRAMRLNREPQPNGLIQGGTQFDPKRILPGIPHEPTTETGLSHTHGALSMAMGDPGTANGDFSIMLQDQTGLDANPASSEPVWQNGYAVFGYVIDGMDVVYAIHSQPADPDKGEGVMRGQILAQPVEIVTARRAPAD